MPAAVTGWARKENGETEACLPFHGSSSRPSPGGRVRLHTECQMTLGFRPRVPRLWPVHQTEEKRWNRDGPRTQREPLQLVN